MASSISPLSTAPPQLTFLSLRRSPVAAAPPSRSRGEPPTSLPAMFTTPINCAVIPKEGSEVDEAEVLRFCGNNLAGFKVPKRVFITNLVPKTATGKIQRRIVVKHFLDRISAAKVPKFGV